MERFQQLKRVLLITLGLNWLVALTQILVGWLSHSASMQATGFHALSDGMSNILGLLGLWLAAKPRDAKHPYGHKKFETFAALGIAMLLLLVALEVFKGGWVRLFEGGSTLNVTWLNYVVLGMSMGISYLVLRLELAYGHQLGSDLLVADAMHTRSDLLTSFSVLVSLIAAQQGVPIVDPLVAMGIAFVIGKAAVDIVRHSADVLCDANVLRAEVIEDLVNQLEPVCRCHDVRTRGRQDDLNVDLHVLVDGDLSVTEAHALEHQIEAHLKANLRGVSSVAVHLEPRSLCNPAACKEKFAAGRKN